MPLFLIIGSLLVLVGIILLLRYRHEKKRTDKFQQVAEELGLPFFPKGDKSLIERLIGNLIPGGHASGLWGG